MYIYREREKRGRERERDRERGEGGGALKFFLGAPEAPSTQNSDDFSVRAMRGVGLFGKGFHLEGTAYLQGGIERGVWGRLIFFAAPGSLSRRS